MNITEITGFDYSTSPLDAHIADTPRYRDMLEAIKDHLNELDRFEAIFAAEMDIPANGDWDLYDLIDDSMDQNHIVSMDDGYQGIQARIHAHQATPQEHWLGQHIDRTGQRKTGYFYDLPDNEGRYGDCDFMKVNRRGEYRFMNDKDIRRFLNNLLHKVNAYIREF